MSISSSAAALAATSPWSRLSAMLLSASLLGCATQGVEPGRLAAGPSYEDIYVLRSVREERLLQSTWCTTERAGFAPLGGQSLIEDRLTMWAVAVDPRDGRVTDAKVASAGEMHACYGVTADHAVMPLDECHEHVERPHAQRGGAAVDEKAARGGPHFEAAESVAR